MNEIWRCMIKLFYSLGKFQKSRKYLNPQTRTKQGITKNSIDVGNIKCIFQTLIYQKFKFMVNSKFAN